MRGFVSNFFDVKLSYEAKIPNSSTRSRGQEETEWPSHAKWPDGFSPGGQSGLGVKRVLLPTDIPHLMAEAQTAVGPRPQITACSQLA